MGPSGSHVARFRGGLPRGMQTVLGPGDAPGVDIELAMISLGPGEVQALEPSVHQTALVLLRGAGTVAFQTTEGDPGAPVAVERRDEFTDLPETFLLPRRTRVTVTASGTSVEWALTRVEGPGGPEVIHIPKGSVRVEERGQGQKSGTYHRQVRTVVDSSNSGKFDLVLGEVLNHPGRWSSYPPHHHPQPEIYYYRFDRPEGYGHAEVGERVFKVRNHDVTLMRSGEDHSQVSAPGYTMYYLWIIRNLKDHAYDVPEFTAEHRWLLSAK